MRWQDSRCRLPIVAIGLLGLVAACQSHPASQDRELLRQIHELEELRPNDAAESLAAILGHESSWFRARAARAIGRLGSAAGERGVDALCSALGDPDVPVRVEAAFALGQLGFAGSAAARERGVGALLPMLESEAEPEVRGRAVEALGKLANEAQVLLLLPALHDSDASVRAFAALAVHRLHSRLALPQRSKTLVLDALLAAWPAEGDERARWCLVYAIAGQREARALDALVVAARRAGSPIERLFGVRAIAGIVRRHELDKERRAALRDLLLRALLDPDVRVATEAAHALGDPSPGGRDSATRGSAPNFDGDLVVQGLVRASQAEHPTLRAAAIRALGHFDRELFEPRRALSLAEGSTHASVRAAAVEAVARMFGDANSTSLRVLAGSDDWRTRLAVTRAIRHLSAVRALDLLELLAKDRERRVRLGAISALAKHGDDDRARTVAAAALTEQDAAIREEAARALAAIGTRTELDALGRAWISSKGPAYVDARLEFVRAVGKIGREQSVARRLLVRALRDPSAAVRASAADTLRDWGDREAVPRVRNATARRHIALPGEAYPVAWLDSRPRVRLRTSRGTVVLELWPDAAPTHCHNLLHFIKKGGYDGRPFHRLVPNFVLQGGDERGDGYGNKTWWGGKLRLEVNPRAFDAFTLGMPRSSDPDSGGDQIFVTLVPTPHLDGRYTAFGRVVEGQSVILDLQVGDRILRATID